MKKYVKFINSQSVQYAPRNYNGVSNYDQDSGRLVKDGYKPLIVVESPTPEKPNVRYVDYPTKVEQYADRITDSQASDRRRNFYRANTDELTLRKIRKTVIGEWTEADEAEYVAKMKELSDVAE